MSTTLKLLKKGLLEGGKAAGSSAASWAGDEISKCLLQLVGYYSEEDRQKDEIKDWMQSVSRQLQILNTIAKDTLKDMENGFARVHTEALFQAYQVQYNSTQDNRSVIDDAYKGLSMIMALDYDNEEQVRSKVQELDDYVKNNSLITCAHSVATTWGAGPHATSRSLLENWTDTCISSMKNSATAVLGHYNNLEYNYILGISYLIKAYSVLIALKNYKNSSSADEPDKVTADWLDEQVATYIKPIGDSFTMCAERLVLATYRPDIIQKTIPMAALDVVNEIGARSQLCYFQLTNMDLELDHPGMIIKEYVCPSMYKKGDNTIEVSLKQSSGDKLVLKGERLVPPAKYTNGPVMPYWYKMVDKNEANELMAFEDSDIVVMYYKQPYEGDVGYMEYKTQKNNQGFSYSKEFKYDYYDRDMLDKKSQNEEGTIAIAYVAILDNLTNAYAEAMPISYPSHVYQPWEFDDADKGDLKKHAKKNTVYVNGPQFNDMATIFSVGAEFDASLFSKEHDFRFYSKYPIKYVQKNQNGNAVQPLSGKKGSDDNVKLSLVHESDLTVYIGDYKNNMKSMRACDVNIEVYASNADVETKYFKHKYTEDTNMYHERLDFESKENKYYPSETGNVDEDKMGIPLMPGAETVLTWKMKIQLQTLDLGMNGYNNLIKGEYKMRGRFAWTVPFPSFS